MLDTPDEKAKFIKDLCDNCKFELLERVKHMPNSWEGMELRQYIADYFAETAVLSERKYLRKRYREYKSDVATRFGL